MAAISAAVFISFLNNRSFVNKQEWQARLEAVRSVVKSRLTGQSSKGGLIRKPKYFNDLPRNKQAIIPSVRFDIWPNSPPTIKPCTNNDLF